MKLIDLLKDSDWEEVKKNLLKYYSSENAEFVITERPRDEYEKVYNHLFTLNVEYYPMQIEIDNKTYDDDNELYPEVYGTNGTLCEDSTYLQRFDLSANTWSTWLGMDISTVTANTVDLNEIVALCLYEMTFNGMDEETIQNFWNCIEKESIELQNMTPEERKKHTYTIEDLRKEFELDEPKE